MVRFGSLVATALVFACSGQALDDDSGGSAAGTGGAGKGGTSGGSTAAGAGVTGGSGGASMGGSAGTAPGAGGSPTAGSGGIPRATGGSGGSFVASAGVAGLCALPLEIGPCRALAFAYGFNATSRHCELFPYGGCEGNENRFETLGECEAACGGSTLAGCPDMLPTHGTECDVVASFCSYEVDRCLCAPIGVGSCGKIDPNCPNTLREGCFGDGCVAHIVVRGPTVCSCTGGYWDCTPA